MAFDGNRRGDVISSAPLLDASARLRLTNAIVREVHSSLTPSQWTMSHRMTADHIMSLWPVWSIRVECDIVKPLLERLRWFPSNPLLATRSWWDVVDHTRRRRGSCRPDAHLRSISADMASTWHSNADRSSSALAFFFFFFSFFFFRGYSLDDELAVS